MTVLVQQYVFLVGRAKKKIDVELEYLNASHHVFSVHKVDKGQVSMARPNNINQVLGIVML